MLPADPSSAAHDTAWEPRAMCGRCERPRVVCYCAHLTTLATATRVLLLQHPREEEVAIGTARMAHLCLPGSELRVGIDFGDDPVVQGIVKGGAETYLLYPGPDATDLAELRPRGPLTLVVVDGTWWQARSLLRRNPSLMALPQVRFTPRALSRYRIRREPAPHCVSTIEALAQVLGVLERDPDRFSALLRPFDAMVEAQLHYATHVASWRRSTRRREGSSGGTRLPALLRERPKDLLCVHGEANAWDGGRPGGHPAEIVQWLAERPATGERFSAVIAPRQPLAPSTPRHLRLSEELLASGETWGEFAARWRAFARPGDVVCSWGSYGIDLLAREGLPLAAARLDVRQVASNFLKRRAGGTQRCLEHLGQVATPAWDAGRGGRQIAALTDVVATLLRQAASSPTDAP